MTMRKERKDAVEHRALILKTAQTLIAEHGLDGVSMHQIAKSAGIGQGTLYRRYANKSDLCLDLIQDSSQCFIEQIADTLKQSEALPVMERMGFVLDGWLDFIEEKSQWLGTIQSSIGCEDRKFYYQSPIYVFMYDTLKRLLTEYAKKYDRPDLNPTFTAHVVLSSWDPNLYVLLQQDLDYTPEQIKLSFRQLFLKSLAP